jgi:hypothetical protein
MRADGIYRGEPRNANCVRKEQMERKKASDFPQGLLNLFDQYVHGAISRRAFLDGAPNFLPSAA